MYAPSGIHSYSMLPQHNRKGGGSVNHERAHNGTGGAQSTRAIMVELGHDRPKWMSELRWLVRSWAEMRKAEADPLVTDLVVFAEMAKMQESVVRLGCTTTPR